MGLVEPPPRRCPGCIVAARTYPPRYVVNLLGVGIALKSTTRSGIGSRGGSGFDCNNCAARRRPSRLRTPLRLRHSQHHCIGFPSALTKLFGSFEILHFKQVCIAMTPFANAFFGQVHDPSLFLLTS